MRRIADLASEKARQHCNQPITWLQFSLRFEARASASFFNTTEASWPMPPQEEKTRGVNEPCSTSLIRSPYCFFLSLSICRKMDLRGLDLQLRAWGQNTLVSKNALLPFVQNPRTLISALASGSVLVTDLGKDSPVNGCNFGSISTSLQISFMHDARMIMPHVDETRQFADLCGRGTYSHATPGLLSTCSTGCQDCKEKFIYRFLYQLSQLDGRLVPCEQQPREKFCLKVAGSYMWSCVGLKFERTFSTCSSPALKHLSLAQTAFFPHIKSVYLQRNKRVRLLFGRWFRNLLKKNGNQRKSFSKTSFHLRMELKK